MRPDAALDDFVRIPVIVTASTLRDCWGQAELLALKEMKERGYSEAIVRQGNTAVIPAFHSETFPMLTVRKNESEYLLHFTIELSKKNDVP